MINFEEELKKFHPSMEVDEVEDAVLSRIFQTLFTLMTSQDLVSLFHPIWSVRQHCHYCHQWIDLQLTISFLRRVVQFL